MYLNSYKKLDKKDESDYYKLNFEVMIKRNPKTKAVSTEKVEEAAPAAKPEPVAPNLKELTVKDILS